MSALPDGVANGPSRSKHSAEYPQIWERPWSLEEIRQHSTDWSLAADSGLFHFLQDFSQRMLSKTHEIEKQLDSLICDTKATDSRLHTVFNDFLMLSNTQFIENRVYDEEVEETISKADALEKQPEPKEKTREQKEAELIPKMQEAVNYGLKVLESAFEHLDIKAGNSDSEDEDISEEMELILEPKDLYVDRPLPSLIGSQSFMEQDDVGLGDLLSDEVSVDSDRDSVIDSDDDKEEAHSDEDSYQEEQEGHNNIKKKSSVISYDEEDEEEEEEDSDLFGSDKEDENNDSNNTGPSSFADELAARIKGETFNRPEGDRASAEEDSNDMFKPPKMDDEDFSLFGGTSGLFSRGKGLFDDDDEGDLFAEAPKPALEEKKATNESIKSAAQTQESNKTIKKIPAGAVSIFPGAGGAGGGGLFDDDEEDDDFFSEKSLKKPDSIVQEKSKPKRPIDLFDDEDDEDGDIFSSKHSIQTPAQTQRKVVEEKPPERKMPPGAVSMFGPATKSLLSEGLKNRQLSTSEESNKSDENAPVTAAVGKASAEQTDKHQTSGLFSDDEELFPTTPKNQLKPEPTSLGKTSKASLSIFDDEEDEDLFAFAAKSKEKPNLVKSSKPQPSNTVSSSLFSDDEQDQWMSSKKKPDTKSEGIKTSTSVPSGLPSTKTSKKSSLFDEEEEDDLFASAKDSNQKKQRVALLFEDEGDDEEGGSLFGIKPAFNTEAPSKTPHATSEPSPSHEEGFVPKTLGNDKRHEQQKPAETPEPPPTSPSQEGATSRKKPAGAVSLFGGIDVLNAQTKTPLDGDDHDDVFLSKERPPPIEEENKEVKGKAKAVSLFDDDGEDEDDEEVDWSDSLFVPSQATTKKTQKSAEERPRLKSTGVFQDEELLFSQTQQKDNDPDVDLFATSETAASSAASSVKPAAQSLFSDDDEDDLFSSVKSKPPPPKVAEKPSRPQDKAPLASPEPVSEIQASLMINPAALLPGAGPSMSGALSSSSGVSSSSLSPSPVSTPIETPAENKGAVSFDTPVQVTTLVSTHKGRVKGSALRRPQSRAARQQAAQKSVDYIGETLAAGPGPTSSLNSLVLPPPEKSRQTIPSSNSAAPSASRNSPRPSELALPATTNVKEDSRKDGSFTKAPPLSDDDNDDDLFGPDGLFGVKSVTNKPTRETTKPSPPQASSGVAEDRDLSTLPSIFDDNNDDLFQTIKPQAASKKPAQVSSFFEDEDDDLFGLNSSSTPTSKSHKEVKTSSSFSKQDIFQDEAATMPKVQKKAKTTDVDLFDDNIDIFADLTDTVKPKQKSKMKGKAKSIFDDAMDDIFSTSTVKPGTKAPNESKKTPPSQEISTSADSSNIFDDPLNALGGN